MCVHATSHYSLLCSIIPLPPLLSLTHTRPLAPLAYLHTSYATCEKESCKESSTEYISAFLEFLAALTFFITVISCRFLAPPGMGFFYELGCSNAATVQTILGSQYRALCLALCANSTQDVVSRCIELGRTCLPSNIFGDASPGECGVQGVTFVVDSILGKSCCADVHGREVIEVGGFIWVFFIVAVILEVYFAATTFLHAGRWVRSQLEKYKGGVEEQSPAGGLLYIHAWGHVFEAVPLTRFFWLYYKRYMLDDRIRRYIGRLVFPHQRWYLFVSLLQTILSAVLLALLLSSPLPSLFTPDLLLPPLLATSACGAVSFALNLWSSCADTSFHKAEELKVLDAASESSDVREAFNCVKMQQSTWGVLPHDTTSSAWAWVFFFKRGWQLKARGLLLCCCKRGA